VYEWTLLRLARFEVFAAVKVQVEVLRVVIPCSVVDVSEDHADSIHRVLRNVDILQRRYTASRARRPRFESCTSFSSEDVVNDSRNVRVSMMLHVTVALAWLTVVLVVSLPFRKSTINITLKLGSRISLNRTVHCFEIFVTSLCFTFQFMTSELRVNICPTLSNVM